MSELVYVKIRPKSFFDKYTFKDIDGEYWETENLRDRFNEGEEYEIPWVEADLQPAIKPSQIGKVINITTKNATMKSWAIEEILLREYYPEYYI